MRIRDTDRKLPEVLAEVLDGDIQQFTPPEKADIPQLEELESIYNED